MGFCRFIQEKYPILRLCLVFFMHTPHIVDLRVFLAHATKFNKRSKIEELANNGRHIYDLNNILRFLLEICFLSLLELPEEKLNAIAYEIIFIRNLHNLPSNDFSD